jgi:hypothetical protein
MQKLITNGPSIRAKTIQLLGDNMDGLGSSFLAATHKSQETKEKNIN